MPFSRITENETPKNKKFATLQVRTFPLKKNPCFTTAKTGKKVSLSLSERNRWNAESASGFVTVEAALALTLFLFASVCLIIPMKIMNTERQIQAALEKAGEDFSRYAYLSENLEQGEDRNKLEADSGAREFLRFFVSGAAAGYARAAVLEHCNTRALQNMTFQKSEVMTDGQSVDLVMDYEIRLPFPILGLPALKRTSRCRRRAWIGIAGKSYAGEAGEWEEDPIVYVGKGSTRYHRSGSCHYLSNNLTILLKSEIDAKRNQAGKRYRPCSVCGRQASEAVYLMPSGESYHTDPDCRAITAYARAVHLSEVKELGACSYCGNGGRS